MKTKRLFVGLMSVVLLGLLFFVATTYAATFISVIQGPTWQGPGSGYETTVCTDTAFGETVYVQTTTNAVPLTGDNNTDPLIHPSWNGTVAACSFGVFEPGGACGGPGTNQGTWICNFPDTPNTTITYRFIVANQSNIWYGVQTGGGSFNTGPTAVSLSSFSANATWPLLLVVVIGLLLGGTAVVKRKTTNR